MALSAKYGCGSRFLGARSRPSPPNRHAAPNSALRRSRPLSNAKTNAIVRRAFRPGAVDWVRRQCAPGTLVCRSGYNFMGARRIFRLDLLLKRAARARHAWLRAKAESDERRTLLAGTKGLWRRK